MTRSIPLTIQKGLAFRQKLAEGRQVVGAWSTLGSTYAAAIMANAGLDFLVIDLEHGSCGIEAVAEQVAALLHLPTAIIVRPGDHSLGTIKRILDAGANGLLVPAIETVAEVTAVVDASHFSPKGNRGVAVGAIAASDYGMAPLEYFENANDALTLFIQLETESSVREAAEIAQVPGVTGYFMGPADLSAGLGVFRQFENDKFTDAVNRIKKAVRQSNRCLGTIPHGKHDAKALFKDGYQFVIATSDQELIRKGSLALFADLATSS